MSADKNITHHPGDGWRKTIRRVLLGLAILVAVAAGLLGASLLWARSEAGMAWLATRISSDLDGNGLDIEVAALEGDIFSRFSVLGLRIADREGVWLSAPRLTVEWAPSALLSRRLHIMEIAGQPVAVSRMPVADASQKQPSGSGELPLAIRVDTASLPIRYDGDSYTLAVTKAAYKNLTFRGQASLVNADNTDRVSALFSWADDTAAFAAKADVQGRAGGLVAGLLGLKGGDSVAVTLDANGTTEEWTGSIVATVPEKLSLQGEAEGQGDRWNIGLRQQENAFVPEALATLFGGAAEADILLRPRSMSNTQVDIKLRAEGADVTLAGRANLDGGFSLTDGDLSLELAQFSTESVNMAKVALRGELELHDSTANLTYTAQMQKLTTAGLVFTGIDASGTAALNAQDLTGEVAALALNLTPPGLEETRVRAADGRWSYNMKSQAWQVSASQATGSGLTARDAMVKGGAGGIKAASGQAEVPTAFLTRWHDGQLTGGRLLLDIRSTGVTEDSARLVGTIKGEKITYDSSAIAELVGSAPTLEARLVITGSKVNISKATLVASNLQANATGQVGGKSIDLDFSGKIGALENLLGESAILAGETAFSGSVKGDSAAPTILFETTLAEIDAYGLPFNNPRITLALSKAAQGNAGLTGEVALLADSPAGATSLKSPVAFTNGTLRLAPINLTAPGLEATGALSWSGDAGLKAEMTGQLRDLAGKGLRLRGDGSVSFNVAMQGDNMEAGVTLDMAEFRLVRPGRFPLTVEIAKGNAHFRKQATTISYDADISARNINYGAQKIDSFSINGTSSDNAPMIADLKGYYGNRFDLNIAAHPRKGGADMDITAVYGDARFSTRDPLLVRWGGPQDLLVELPVTDVAGGTLQAKLSLEAQDLNIQVNADALSMTLMNLVRPGSVETGTLDADITFERQAGTETGNAEITFQSLTLPRWRLAAAPDEYAGKLRATMQEGALTFEGGLTEAGREFGSLTGKIPYERLDGRQGYAIRAGAPLAMEIVWSGDVAPVWLLARRPEHMLTGTLDGKITLSGDLNDPYFEGQLDLKDGHYEYEPLGLVAEIEVLRVAGTQEQIELAELRANDGDGGMLTGEGAFALSSKLSFPGRLTAKMSDFQVARLDELSGKASAELVYERTEQAATLSGQVETGPMRVKMPKELPRGVVEIDVIEINGTEDNGGSALANDPQKNLPTNLSLAIEVPGRFFFEGRGLKSEWQGELMLGGTSDEPEITGNMSIRDGSFSFGSKTFEITNGQLAFRGGSTIDPDISVTAVHSTPNLEARLQISGPSSAPEFTLTSSPSLPEDEIMARVLLGKSVSDLSAFQLAELVVAMDTLRGGGSFDVMGKLRRGLGLDTLSFGRIEDDDETATTITGGKYLRKNIYLEVETSTASSETATRLKIDITRNLLVETELGPRQGSSLRLKWFWDY
ncbi:translocation/assembly module TamB domain-containing protein [Kordiimonas sp.]|uniref:translocation/assembly module TamB domain-containing protein n=1 Tax=Kordiimonas sp. TaxID=1970157 RepID=UPI003A93804F